MKKFKFFFSLLFLTFLLFSPMEAMGKTLRSSAADGALEISKLSLSTAKFDPKASALKITFTTNDACSVYCGVYDENNNTVAMVSNGGAIANAGNWSLTWKGTNSNKAYVAPGTYTIAIGLSNEAGEESETLYQKVEVVASNNSNAGSAPILSNLSLNLTKLRPGTDTVKISFNNDKECKAYCDVYDSNNVKVATVANGGSLTKANRWFYSWKGVGSNGNYLTGGVYQIKMALTNQYGKSKILSVSIEITSTNSSSSSIVSFKDKNLEKSIRNILEKPTGNILVSEIKNIRSLDLATVLTITNLSGLENFTGLTYLNLGKNSDANNIIDLTPLKGLKNLQELYLNFNEIVDLTPLSSLTNLRLLQVGGNKITNVSPLRNLTNLRALYLGISSNGGENYISDLSPIKGLVNLTELSIYSNSKIKNIDAILGMTKMQRLNLRGAAVSNLDFAKNMPNLQALDVGGISSRVSSLEPLRNLGNLIELNMDGNRISNIKPIEGLSQLQTLCIAGNNISNIDSLKMLPNLKTLKLGTGCGGGNPITSYAVLSNMRNLEHLELAYSKVKSIDYLRGLTKLNYLDLQHNDLVSLDAIRGLVSMKELIVNDNRINNIDALTNMTGLTYLMLTNNNISDLEPLRNTTKLQVLHLKNNNITDYSPIESYYRDIYNTDFK